MLDFNAARQTIRKVGASNVRVLPMEGQNVTDGDYQIEVNEGGWKPIVAGVKKFIAEQLVNQALNRVICG